MSITIDFAFNAPGTLEAVREMVNACLGATLAPYEGEPSDLFCRFFGLELSLRVSELVDDRDLDFTRYRFLLNTRTPAGSADLRAYQLEITALSAYALFLRGNVVNGILAYDVQVLLARYTKAKSGGVHDEIAGTLVRFPDHLVHLRARAPARGR